MNRTERLFALAEALRARRTGVTAQSLAERFGVSVRTVLRDLDALRAAHVPVSGERGRGGGIVLDKSYAMPPVSFSAREALLLLALGRFAQQTRALPFTDTLASALDKVRAALPATTQRQLQRMDQSVTFVGVPQHHIDPRVRQAIETSLFEGAVIRIAYEKPDGSVTKDRHVRVDSIVIERSETLLNCFDLDKNEPRQFRAHRVQEAHTIDVGAPRDAAPTPRAADRTASRPRRR